MVDVRPPINAASDCDTHVIFVHGLTGDFITTWQTHGVKPEFWPDWLGADLPNVAVWSMGYPAGASRWGKQSGMALMDRAANILSRLISEPGLSRGTIIFVGHSLGGVVIKAILRKADSDGLNRDDVRQLLKRVQNVAFISTPHGGSDQATNFNRLSWLTQPLATTAGLSRNNPELRDLNDWFRNYFVRHALRCVSYQETKRVNWFGQIVKLDSSDPGLAPPATRVPLDEDHYSIVKPPSRSADLYVDLLRFVKEAAARATVEPDGTPQFNSGGWVATEATTASQQTFFAPAGSSAIPLELADKRTRIILSFEGDEADYPPDRISSMIEAIRTLTGNPTVRLISTGQGSFRMLIEGTALDHERLSGPESFDYFQRVLGAKLLGVADEISTHEADRARNSLMEASKSLLNWPRTLPDGTFLDRPELEPLLETLVNNDTSTTVILGPPGSGKSAFLAALGHKVADMGGSLIAIKADLLDPEVDDEQKLAAQLRLPQPLAPIIASISLLKPIVLIIDQLDALSGYVDLRTGRLSVLLNLVRRLSGKRNVHIVMSARAFEYVHDARLKTIQADSLHLDLPPLLAVLDVLKRHGIDAAGWPLAAKELLRTPQVLVTFLKLQPNGAQPYTAYRAMLEELWDQLILQHPHSAELSTLASDIAQQLAEQEAFWISAARFDDKASELRALKATGIITDSPFPGSIGFSHQTIFEYVLARTFARNEGTLSNYVLKREASLFVRPQVWAALSYLRDVEPAAYQIEFRAIWTLPNLRLHLRHLLIEFLGQQPQPTDNEELFLVEAIGSVDRAAALQAIIGSPGWFARLKRTIGSAMVDPSVSNIAHGILYHAWSFAREDVVLLLNERWVSDAKYDSLTLSVLDGCTHWTDAVGDIAIILAGRNQAPSFLLDHMIGTVGVEQPDIAMRLLSAVLNARLAVAFAEAERRASLPTPSGEKESIRWLIHNSPGEPIKDLIERSDGMENFEGLAGLHPAKLLDVLWPWLQRALEKLRQYENDQRAFGFALPYAFDFRFEGENALNLPEHSLLGALRTSVETLASAHEPEFLAWLAANENENATSAQRLFAHSLAGEAEKYASRALKFLLDDPNRFHLGGTGISARTTAHLVASVSPYWSDAEVELFNEAVMRYSPSPASINDVKSRQWFYRYIRRLKGELLEQVAEERHSTAVRSFILEQRRQFADGRSEEIVEGPMFIGSPISRESLSLARDEDVVNAFRELPDSTGWENPNSWMQGGNVQLSREFAEYAKEQPERAGRIIRKFEASSGTRAAGYALEEMADKAEPGLILDLIEVLDSRGFTGPEFMGNAAHAVEKLVRRKASVDDGTVAMLERWLRDFPLTLEVHAYGDEKSDRSEGDSAKTPNQGHTQQTSILWGSEGHFFLPQGSYPILEILVRIYLVRKDFEGLHKLLNAHLIRNDKAEVWRAVLRFIPFIPATSSEPLEHFLTDLFNRYPEIERSREAAIMFTVCQWTVPELVRRRLVNWERNVSSIDAQLYGELIGLIALVQPTLTWTKEPLARILREPDWVEARTGLAYAAINAWAAAGAKSAVKASELLQTIIPQADDATWHAIFDLFRLVDAIQVEQPWIDLLECLSKHIHNATNADSTFIVTRLEELLPHQAGLVGAIAGGLIKNWRAELGDTRTRTSFAASGLVDIALTLHRAGPDTRELGLTLFEDLLEANAYTVRSILEEIDNRIRPGASPTRKRLPRRKQPRRPVRRI